MQAPGMERLYSPPAEGDREGYDLLTRHDLIGIRRIRIAYGGIVLFLLTLGLYLGAQAVYILVLDRVGLGAQSIGLTSTLQGPALLVLSAGFVSGGLGAILFLALRRFFSPPIVSVGMDRSGILFVDSRGKVHRVDVRDPRICLVVETYPQLRFENLRGHWGYCRIARGAGGGLCQFDEVVLRRILDLAASAGLKVERKRHNTLEGPSERLTITRGQGRPG